jgi:hypothetical protein
VAGHPRYCPRYCDRVGPELLLGDQLHRSRATHSTEFLKHCKHQDWRVELAHGAGDIRELLQIDPEDGVEMEERVQTGNGAKILREHLAAYLGDAASSARGRQRRAVEHDLLAAEEALPRRWRGPGTLTRPTNLTHIGSERAEQYSGQ